MIITIDGLDGSGKSSLAKNLAMRLNFKYIDKPLFVVINLFINYLMYLEIITYYMIQYIKYKTQFIIKLIQTNLKHGLLV